MPRRTALTLQIKKEVKTKGVILARSFEESAKRDKGERLENGQDDPFSGRRVCPYLMEKGAEESVKAKKREASFSGIDPWGKVK
jgi:hypothetical protein